MAEKLLRSHDVVRRTPEHLGYTRWDGRDATIRKLERKVLKLTNKVYWYKMVNRKLKRAMGWSTREKIMKLRGRV